MAFGIGNPSVGSLDVPQDHKGWLQTVRNWFETCTTPSSKTAAYTVGANVFFVACDVTSAGFTVTLPEAKTCAGRQIAVKKTDASGNTLTVGRSGSDLIDGATTVTTTTQYKAWVFYSDGVSNWWIM